jgi:hypothetical protein
MRTENRPLSMLWQDFSFYAANAAADGPALIKAGNTLSTYTLP